MIYNININININNDAKIIKYIENEFCKILEIKESDLINLGINLYSITEYSIIQNKTKQLIDLGYHVCNDLLIYTNTRYNILNVDKKSILKIEDINSEKENIEFEIKNIKIIRNIATNLFYYYKIKQNIDIDFKYIYKLRNYGYFIMNESLIWNRNKFMVLNKKYTDQIHDIQTEICDILEIDNNYISKKTNNLYVVDKKYIITDIYKLKLNKLDYNVTETIYNDLIITISDYKINIFNNIMNMKKEIINIIGIDTWILSLFENSSCRSYDFYDFLLYNKKLSIIEIRQLLELGYYIDNSIIYGGFRCKILQIKERIITDISKILEIDKNIIYVKELNDNPSNQNLIKIVYIFETNLVLTNINDYIYRVDYIISEIEKTNLENIGYKVGYNLLKADVKLNYTEIDGSYLYKYIYNKERPDDILSVLDYRKNIIRQKELELIDLQSENNACSRSFSAIIPKSRKNINKFLLG